MSVPVCRLPLPPSVSPGPSKGLEYGAAGWRGCKGLGLYNKIFKLSKNDSSPKRREKGRVAVCESPGVRDCLSDCLLHSQDSTQSSRRKFRQIECRRFCWQKRRNPEGFRTARNFAAEWQREEGGLYRGQLAPWRRDPPLAGGTRSRPDSGAA